MKETILLAPSVNGTELLRSLAQHNVGTFGMRVMGPGEFAAFVLMRSGLTEKRGLVTPAGARSLIFRIMQEIPYYKNISFSDASDMTSVLTSVRELIPENEAETLRTALTGGEFPEANAALLETCEKYLKALDDLDLTDLTALQRLAAEECAPLTAEVLTLEEYPLSPLTERLASRASGGKYKTTTLKKLFGLEDKPLAVNTVTESYGSMNEIRDVLDTILKNKLPYDTCTVACADSSAAVMFHELADEFGVPVTFGSGLPVSCTAPAVLLHRIVKWHEEGMCGITTLNDLIYSGQFDRFALTEALGCKHAELHKAVNAAGALRLSFDNEENARKLTAALAAVESDEDRNALILAEKLFAELGQGIAYIVKNYSVIRPVCKGLDTSAVTVICSELEACGSVKECFDMLPAILGKSVGAQNRTEGAVHIVSIAQAPAALRKELFITGLTAANYPGSPKEDHLICDDDLLRFGNSAPTSSKLIADKQRAFRTLMELASAAECNVCLSYSGFDTAELKENNPSSLLFEVLREKNGGTLSDEDMKKLITKKGFFSAEFTPSDKAVRAYAEGEILTPDAPAEPELTNEYDLARSFSITNFIKYAKCPKSFYYAAVLRLRAPEKDEPMEIVSGIDTGNIIHGVMEKYFIMQNDTGKRMTEQELIDETRKAWESFLAKRPPIKYNEAIKLGDELVSMARYCYQCDKDNTIIDAEKPFSFTHKSGFTLKAKFDRIEKLQNGALIVADFKTDQKPAYKPDDFDTCAQVMLYSYILEKEFGIKVGRGEYRLLRHGRTVQCAYTDDMRSAVEAYLDRVAEALKNDDFPMSKKKTPCKYCDYKPLCGREDE